MPHSRLASPSATRAVMEAHGLATRKNLGQHFLIDDNVIGRVLALADLAGDETVLEVGPGIGTLTVALCKHAGAVVAVERDRGLVPALEETTADCPRFALVMADAARVSAEAVSEPFGPPVALVANLPYQVAATVVLRFFEILSSLEQATVMVQAEVADRMAAQPGSKDYGAYTVKLRLYARPTGKFPVARGCFLPPPRVDSTVIRLDREAPLGERGLLEAAAEVADAAFAQRRKTIRNSLRAVLGRSEEDVDAALEATGIDGRERAEVLEPERFVELAKAFAALDREGE
ncbi:MAG: 16S rRNA (adenine(1518)-N(6)/adenine(1519)-N(6))-dimethyltransferase RsmA [Coriobacteriales bacterium]|nr:16S rRNA (adenine(1518)-N(6)/adenine(1519)-N(6))-dimethyltransferase RsmA [Coriobacteriales bacterium]